SPVFAGLVVLAFVGYAVSGVMRIGQPEPPAAKKTNPDGSAVFEPPELKPAAVMPASRADWLGALAGLCAVAAVCLPAARDFGRVRGRRILALARLSFKEAVR